MAKGLKFLVGLYYLCSENKGVDQFHGYRAADLRLCFGINEKQVFSGCGSFINMTIQIYQGGIG